MAHRRDIKLNQATWRYFENVAPGYKKTILHWVATAKKAETSKVLRMIPYKVKLLADKDRFLVRDFFR